MVVEQLVHRSLSLAFWPATVSGISRRGVWGVPWGLEPRERTVQLEAGYSFFGPISAGGVHVSRSS